MRQQWDPIVAPNLLMIADQLTVVMSSTTRSRKGLTLPSAAEWLSQRRLLS
jgi:hypothetical protein